MVCRSPAARAAQDQRERVPLLAAERRAPVGQPGDVGIQAGLRAGSRDGRRGRRARRAGLGRPGAGRSWLAAEGRSGAGRLLIPGPRLFTAALILLARMI